MTEDERLIAEYEATKDHRNSVSDDLEYLMFHCKNKNQVKRIFDEDYEGQFYYDIDKDTYLKEEEEDDEDEPEHDCCCKCGRYWKIGPICDCGCSHRAFCYICAEEDETQEEEDERLTKEYKARKDHRNSVSDDLFFLKLHCEDYKQVKRIFDEDYAGQFYYDIDKDALLP
jgi:hypothetical protein